MPSNRIVSVAEAARLTGLPKQAILTRLERGELRAVRRAGLRRISVDELAERGLLGGGSSGDHHVITELLDRLERQAGEITRLRVELMLAHRRLETERRRRRVRR